MAVDQKWQRSTSKILCMPHSIRTRSAMAYAVSRIFLNRFDAHTPKQCQRKTTLTVFCFFVGCLFMHAKPVCVRPESNKDGEVIHWHNEKRHIYAYNRLNKNHPNAPKYASLCHRCLYPLPDGIYTLGRVIVLHVAVFPFFYFVFFVIARPYTSSSPALLCSWCRRGAQVILSFWMFIRRSGPAGGAIHATLATLNHTSYLRIAYDARFALQVKQMNRSNRVFRLTDSDWVAVAWMHAYRTAPNERLILRFRTKWISRQKIEIE